MKTLARRRARSTIVRTDCESNVVVESGKTPSNQKAPRSAWPACGPHMSLRSPRDLGSRVAPAPVRAAPPSSQSVARPSCSFPSVQAEHHSAVARRIAVGSFCVTIRSAWYKLNVGTLLKSRNAPGGAA